MGAWGPSLCSSDFALDLRTTIGAVLRLPFDENRLLDILVETQAAVANTPNDEDYTTFWLVIADQFAKRGVASERDGHKALAIIDTGSDLAMCAELGMSASNLRKRTKLLQDLRARITTSKGVTRSPSVLKQPQPYPMDIGDLFVYPTCNVR